MPLMIRTTSVRAEGPQRSAIHWATRGGHVAGSFMNRTRSAGKGSPCRKAASRRLPTRPAA
eukprot:1855712-Lingulodinium_polyedra.AAC.1